MKVKRTALLWIGHFFVLLVLRSFALIPAILHLVLIGTIALVVVFWVCLGLWIVVRLAKTAKKGEPLP